MFKENLKEFKAFISRGNVIDMAVGVIIGAAFGKIVTSLVNDILMPLIGVVMGGVDLTAISWKIGDATIAYGTFFQQIIDFLIIAACIFVMMQIINKYVIRKKPEAEKSAEKSPEKAKDDKKTDAQTLKTLEEIRDLLKKSQKPPKKSTK